MPFIDKPIKKYLTILCAKGAIVNSAIVIASAEGIVKSEDETLLQVNDGHLSFSTAWTQSLLHHIGFVKHRTTTKSKILVSDFDHLKNNFYMTLK